MKIIRPLFLALLGALFAQTILACDRPDEISIPDGDTASEQDMLDAGTSYRQYMLDMQLYQVCLRDEADLERRGANASSKERARAVDNTFASRHNAASAAMERATEAFNKTIAIYNARQ